ncbi:MAG: glycoside hydrolase family 2 protein [Ferruginibacter sp.]|uniref:glycosyl hydrolase n=1 Tax=Ferruginibacter sp. TaxID=1940288 RepID=UPI0026588BF1|nr:glycosyl hydrolase [Ferruginibacter sp.]MDB5276388.1 glycoside hydrolase family 2 protein [Ferruginibacter sp.]
MKKSGLILWVVCCFGLHTQAQIKWPPITQTTKPWTRWWWEGSAVDKPGLTAAMQLYQQAGLGGLEITPIYGVKGAEDKFIDFLSPKWIRMLQHTLAEAKRLNLGIDLANATGWPFGGPWVTPADACKNINVKSYSLKEGEQLNEAVRFTQPALVRTVSGAPVDIKTLSYPVATNKNLQSYAFDQLRYEMPLALNTLMAYSDKGDIIELTGKVDASGKLNWTAPAGNWKLTALFIGWHGKMVERAAPGGEGDVIDHFNADALKHYLDKFDTVFKNKDISGIRAWFNDSYEVDDARGQSNWTPDFTGQFKLRRGYDIKNYLPQLFARDSTEISRRVLSDYRQTISELVLDNFTKPWQHWAAGQKKLVRNQSHGSPANILDCYAVVDIPETEGEDIVRFKFATSTANIMGKPLASSETATWLNEHFQSSLGDVKQAVDKYFVGGVNHVFWHGTSYSPQNDPWPGWLFYAAVHFTPANPFWKDFGTLNNYVTRCQSFLQQGKPDNDVLLYFPFNDKNAQPGRDMLNHFDGMEGFEKTIFKETAEWLLNKGFSFDLISDKQVIEQVKSKGELLQTAKRDYKTILLSDVKIIPLETMQQLVDLATGGATIMFHHHIPNDIPGLFQLQQRQEKLNAIIASLNFTNTGSGSKIAPVGKGYFLTGDNLDELMATAKVQREKLVDMGLQYNRRSYHGGHYYFISNPGKQAVAAWVPLQTTEKNIALFNPMTVNNGLAKTRVRNGVVETYLQLEAGESCILQTATSAITGKQYAYYKDSGEPVKIEGNWTIQFIKGGPSLPAKTERTALGSWTELAGEEVKKFSGTATYSISFDRPAGIAKAFVLNLGNVQETAEVWLNNKKLATLIGPTFQLTIDAAVLKQQNLLQVTVTNGMPNRILDLEQQGLQWKKFYNTNFPAKLAVNRGADGLFTPIKWQPKAAGLIGPVTLTPVILQ